MAVKMYQAKIRCETPEHRRALDLTHRIFNKSVARILPILYAARRGDHGPEFTSILSEVNTSQKGPRFVEAITKGSRPWISNSKEEWADHVRILHHENRLLFDRENELPGLSSEFRRKVFEMCFQIILGQDTKLQQWREAHDEWLRRKAKWEADNPKYMAVRPVIEAFEQTEGKVSKRRGRWHRWLTFLQSHPELAAWCGAAAEISPLTDEDLRLARRNNRRAVARAFEMFWKKNPELEELDHKHGYYEREFVRRWAKRRHYDGFFHTPTLTLPSAMKHPAWYQFKKGASYFDLDLLGGSIVLRLIVVLDDDGLPEIRRMTFQFQPDARLRRLQPAREVVSVGREKCNLELYGQDGQPPRHACIKGAKLVYQGGLPYLFFTVFIADTASRLSVRQANIDKYPFNWSRKHLLKLESELDSPMRTMALDLGIRHIAASTVMEGEQLIATRFISNRPVSAVTGRRIDGIPTLDQIAALKREQRRLLRKRGKPVRGEEACVRLAHHLRRMAEDRFKKCSRAIVDLARHHRVDLILLENLEGLIPDAARDRGINKALTSWNRGNLVQWVKMLAEEYGMRSLEVPPYYTSKVCHRCNALGVRYFVKLDEMTVKRDGKLFGCPECGYRANADFNASINLHRVFRGTFPEAHKAGPGRLKLNGKVVASADARTAWEQRWTMDELAAQAPF